MDLEPEDYLVPSSDRRTIPRVGDFFAFRLGSGAEFLGRVAAVGARELSVSGRGKVIYIYAPGTPTRPPPAYLPATSIWIGPMIANP
jgi:hypothetical protein